MAADKRKGPRRTLHLPVRVEGHDTTGSPWGEVTTTEDISHGGLAIRLSHHVLIGHVVQTSLPLPETYRRYDLGAAFYRIYCLVRHVVPGRPPVRVGVMFLGKRPPKGFEENPGGLFLLPSDPKPAWAVMRAHPRYELLVNVRLRRAETWAGGATEELTITEDISLGGAKVRTSLPIGRGELVDLEEVGGALRTRALVQHVSIGKDNAPRLHLQFLESAVAEQVREILRRHGIH